MEIENQLALVTGAASGLGAETANYLHKAGAKLALWDINEQKLAEIAEQLSAYAIPCDITNSESVANATTDLVNHVGAPRIWVNCAGIAPAARILGRNATMSDEHFSRAVSVNLLGSFHILRAAAEVMSQLSELNEDGERGVIINTASIAAFEGQIGQLAYSASKGAVAAMTLPAARELAKFGIRVMTIAPGVFATPMVAGMRDDVQISLAEQIPFPKRLGKACEYAKTVLHIIDNVMLNGTVIRLDGGMRMQPK